MLQQAVMLVQQAPAASILPTAKQHPTSSIFHVSIRVQSTEWPDAGILMPSCAAYALDGQHSGVLLAVIRVALGAKRVHDVCHAGCICVQGSVTSHSVARAGRRGCGGVRLLRCGGQQAPLRFDFVISRCCLPVVFCMCYRS